MNSNMVSVIFGSLALVILFRSVNCSTEMRDAAHGGSKIYANIHHSEDHKALRIGVQMRSNMENPTTNITGFSVRVFEMAVTLLPHNITYRLIPFNASPHELVREVARKTFDVAIGDIVTTAGPYQRQLVKFSLPYLQPGFMMVVKAKNNEVNNFWLFLSPFTPKMWAMAVAFNVLMGAVIWIIEGQDNDGPNFLEILFFVHEQPIRSNAARTLKIVWVFVMLMLAEVYTSMITTMLTNSSQPEPSILDIDSLKRTNAPIGCDREFQTIWYLAKVMGFKRRNIRIIAAKDKYAEALSSGTIKAAFLLKPYAKAFLAKNCADFTDIKPTYGYNLGGFRFVFPKGSPLATEISEAILALKESGELQLMEEEMSSFSDCSRKPNEDPKPIGPSPFRGLFVIGGGIVAIALLITLIKLFCRHWEERIRRIMLISIQLWLLLDRLRNNVAVQRILT